MASDRQANSARVRENEETFARANDQIRTSAERYDFNEAVPFLCECSEASCTESIRLSLSDYREARGEGAAFILLPGHDDPHVERIVAQGDGYVLVEKFS
jgi:hypothetical protein